MIFIFQERVSQIVPAVDGAGLLQYLTVLCNLSIAGAGLRLLPAFVIFLLQERVSQHVRPCQRRSPALNSFCNLSTSGAGFSTWSGPCQRRSLALNSSRNLQLQELVSQHVPTFVGASLLRCLNSFQNLATSGVGFSTCSGHCQRRPPTTLNSFYNLSSSGAGFSTCSILCRRRLPIVSEPIS